MPEGLLISTVTLILDASNPSAKLIGLDIYLANALPFVEAPDSPVLSLLIVLRAVTTDIPAKSIAGETVSDEVVISAFNLNVGIPPTADAAANCFKKL